ncbi:MAG: hypothetical protein WCI96_13000, partial [Planctomycetota bacterium]
EWSYDVQGNGGDYGRGLVIRDNGDILLTGRSISGWPSYTDCFTVYRINAYGVTQQEFNYDLGANEFVDSSLALPDGKILLVGTSDNDLTVSRHLPSGQLDTTFGSSGKIKIPVLSSTDEGYRATLAADGDRHC